MIRDNKTLDELKRKIENLQLNQTIDCIYCVRDKITEPNNSGNLVVDVSLRISKEKSFPLMREKYYFTRLLFNDSSTVLTYMYNNIGKVYNSDSFREGFSLEQVYKMLNRLDDEMIAGGSSSVYRHYISKERAEKKMMELTKTFRIKALEKKIKDIETIMKNLDKMKEELENIKAERYDV